MQRPDPQSAAPEKAGSASSSRRSVLKWAATAAASAVAFGVNIPGLRLNEAFAQAGAVDLGGGDFGVLNYAYALEQLEAAFYTQVLAHPYEGMSGYEHSTLRDIRDHEIAHREFFRRALGSRRIPDLTPNFSAVNFGSRQSVLSTASTFEDLGVSAYNGGGQAIRNPAYLAAAGSIVSVEARHAAILRDLINPLSPAFAGFDVVDFSGLDVARAPSQVLMVAAPFIATPITATQLPCGIIHSRTTPMQDPVTILDGIDPDLADHLGSKRELFQKVAGKLGILATTPVVLAAASTEAFSQGLPAQIVDIINFALTLEYLEDEFYRTALAAGFIPGQFTAVFNTISRHESEHVFTLTGALGGAAVPKPRFDFTARGKYPDIFSNFRTFALVSQTLEDTGVAAYKGQAPKLTGGGALLTTALRIHSVEARHAAEVRRVRGVRPWNGAFDRPMSKAQVLAAAMPFIAG